VVPADLAGQTLVQAGISGRNPVLKDLQEAVPNAGFSLTEGEIEERDAESNWTGSYTGQLAIREVRLHRPALGHRACGTS
jgi:hypothetical protein